VKTIAVKDLMLPLSEYATVPQDATLYDAVLAYTMRSWPWKRLKKLLTRKGIDTGGCWHSIKTTKLWGSWDS
jgi:hypothetical protein